jgi:septal ring factor EnvC (AmiA/AmiB activator)
MKYNCNACGRLVEAGQGCSCYKPTPPRTELEQVQSLCDSYRRDLDRERKRIAELEAENKQLRVENAEVRAENTVLLSSDLVKELEADNQRMREALAQIDDASNHYAMTPTYSEGTLRYAHKSTRNLARAALSKEVSDED